MHCWLSAWSHVSRFTGPQLLIWQMMFIFAVPTPRAFPCKRNAGAAGWCQVAWRPGSPGMGRCRFSTCSDKVSAGGEKPCSNAAAVGFLWLWSLGCVSVAGGPHESHLCRRVLCRPCSLQLQTPAPCQMPPAFSPLPIRLVWGPVNVHSSPYHLSPGPILLLSNLWLSCSQGRVKGKIIVVKKSQL